MQIESKEVGHESVVAESVSFQFPLQFLVSIFAFATRGILIVDAVGYYLPSETIGDDGASVGALGVDLDFDHNRSRLRPGICLIFHR